MEKLQRLPFKARNAVFQRLEQIVDIAAMSKEDRMKYDESIKVYRDKLAVTAYAEEKGRAEGLAEGMEKGQEEERLKKRTRHESRRHCHRFDSANHRSLSGGCRTVDLNT